MNVFNRKRHSNITTRIHIKSVGETKNVPLSIHPGDIFMFLSDEI